MTGLMTQFLLFNRLHFSSSLPTDTIVKWSRRIGRSTCGLYDGDKRIYIHSGLRPFVPVWKLTLLHEMAHLATADEQAAHGPRWLKIMHQLARKGVFDNLW